MERRGGPWWTEKGRSCHEALATFSEQVGEGGGQGRTGWRGERGWSVRGEGCVERGVEQLKNRPGQNTGGGGGEGLEEVKSRVEGGVEGERADHTKPAHQAGEVGHCLSSSHNLSVPWKSGRQEPLVGERFKADHVRALHGVRASLEAAGNAGQQLGGDRDHLASLLWLTSVQGRQSTVQQSQEFQSRTDCSRQEVLKVILSTSLCSLSWLGSPHLLGENLLGLLALTNALLLAHLTAESEAICEGLEVLLFINPSLAHKILDNLN